MAPLSEAAAAALLAVLSKRHGRHVLPRDLVVAKLVEFFARRGESISDLPLAVDEEDVPSWETLWLEIAADAGIEATSDRRRLVDFLRVRSKPEGDTAVRDASGLANVALAACCLLRASKSTEPHFYTAFLDDERSSNALIPPGGKSRDEVYYGGKQQPLLSMAMARP